MADSKDQPSMAHSESPEALTPLQVRQILAPTDLSPHSDDALRYALRLALALNAKLVLLHVAEVYVDPPSGDHTLRILHEAPCPVLVVRPPHAPAPAKPA